MKKELIKELIEVLALSLIMEDDLEIKEQEICFGVILS
jgi:hypothetical protein